MRSLLIVSVGALFAIGLMMVFNTSSAEVLDRALAKSTHQALLRQVAFALIGIFFACFVYKIGYDSLLRLSPYVLICATVLLILVFVPPFAMARNGAHRWFSIGHFSFQPSELVKFLVPLTFIEWAINREEITFAAFVKILLFLAVPMALIIIEPDNGTVAVICATLTPLFFLTKIPPKYWVIPMLILATVGGTVAFQLPYVRSRIQVYLHPESDIKGKGHQAYQAKIAAGSGKLLGRGAGSSLQKLTYLPEAQNDYIAAIFAEEFGFVGMLLLITLYMLLSFAGFAIAMQANDRGSCLVAATVTYLIALQAFLNLGVVSGLLPSKGVNLPFFSQGGTSLVANLIGIAALLNVGRDGEKEKNHFECRRNGRSSLPGARGRKAAS
ncbi:MAG: putative peptidoglycan glycosyltransferase FtsW [Chlamydiales bacterium]|nr:putative peptidoglycan glycosyltransferase FtsW [Chlamydiales bacterium]MCH9635382.1 putative peptidoglycan glycosyltransferase FtsW [Chlamydiales bacterium]MCH9704207.1 putative lipid II flippase FtsW [Chlamydiota bacterium]